MDRRGRDPYPWLIVGYGVMLFLGALVHYRQETRALRSVGGPVAALVMDGVPALALAYAGYWLSTRGLSAPDHRRIAQWCFGGSALFVAAIGATFLVRLFEGRTPTEPVFPLLIAAEAGGLAGVVSGYYNVQALRDARRARTVTDALTFVNSLIRHDLRNDLNVIRGHAELLAGDESGDAARGPDSAATIEEKSEEALRRIETTRAITNTLIGEPDLDTVDLASMTAEIATRTENAFDIPVVADLPDRAPVTANAGLRSVVDNLLENAAEHNDADEPEIEIVVDRDPNAVTLRVSDNGSGIPEAEQEALFESPADSEGGGLSLVRTLVEGYGGDIRVEDNDPTGTTFVVTLPPADATGDESR
ncbi:ATP-binding protein [Halobellus sp. EA9]|uniref:ATP-binding protein n=1 Tax=Halobellus sp. EA9 TaxID=3421647 RepID=UPI003EBA9145